MSRAAIGDRVGALLSMSATHARLIGFGTYQGDEVPPADIGGLNIGIPNPKLVMDDGTVVWGCECWWGSEEKIKEKIAALAIIPVDMAKERQ